MLVRLLGLRSGEGVNQSNWLPFVVSTAVRIAVRSQPQLRVLFVSPVAVLQYLGKKLYGDELLCLPTLTFPPTPAVGIPVIDQIILGQS